jgi:hypothetical protein
MKTFKTRKWLNRDNSASTGSIVIYDGEPCWERAKKHSRHIFLEISDCQNSIRLHKTDQDSKKNWIKKIEDMIDSLQQYVEWLKSKPY